MFCNVLRTSLGNHTFYTFGDGCGWATKKNAGCGVMLNRRFLKRSNATRVESTPGFAQGRGGTTRKQSHCTDLAWPHGALTDYKDWPFEKLISMDTYERDYFLMCDVAKSRVLPFACEVPPLVNARIMAVEEPHIELGPRSASSSRKMAPCGMRSSTLPWLCCLTVPRILGCLTSSTSAS